MKFFGKKKTESPEALANGMTFSFKITPKIPDDVRDEFSHHLVRETEFMENFDEPSVKYEEENDLTRITIRFWKSKLHHPIDDPFYKEKHAEFINYVKELFKINHFDCERIEAGVLIDLRKGLTFALYLDKEGNQILDSEKQIEYTKKFLLDKQVEASNQDRCQELFSLKKYDEAITCFDKLLEADPDDDDALNLKGISLQYLEKYDEAITCFGKALEINPNHVRVLNNKGLALGELGKHKEAIECFDKAIEIEPNYDKAFFNKGVELELHGKLEEAIEYYDKAIGINPNYEKALIRKGLFQIKKNLSSKKTLQFPKTNIDIFCPVCETKTELIRLEHYEVDQKNPADMENLNKDYDLVYPEMTKATYDIIKDMSGDRTTLFFAMIAKIESHKKGLSKENCDFSNQVYKVFIYFFIKHETQTAGWTFRLIEKIPNDNPENS